MVKRNGRLYIDAFDDRGVNAVLSGLVRKLCRTLPNPVLLVTMPFKCNLHNKGQFMAAFFVAIDLFS